MITVDYLKTILDGFVCADGHTVDTEEEVIDAPDIMDGLTQLAQTKGKPFAVLFEEAYHYDDDDRIDVPITRFEQSIYVMRLVNRDKGSRPEELKCFDDVRHLRALLMARYGAGDPEMQGWDRTAKRDFVEGVANYVGWKLKLPFTENEDWTLPAPPEQPQNTD